MREGGREGGREVGRGVREGGREGGRERGREGSEGGRRVGLKCVRQNTEAMMHGCSTAYDKRGKLLKHSRETQLLHNTSWQWFS